jgi:Flp pilus assembly protein TadD
VKKLITLFIVAISVVPLPAFQTALGSAVADRARHEALQHYRLGQDALRSEHFDAAEQEFQKSAKLDSTLELAPYGLGQVYMATKRYRPAIVAFEKSRDVFQANVVSAAGDQLAQQRRVNDYIKELEDQKAIYSQPGRGARTGDDRGAALVARYMQNLDMQISALKNEKMRVTGGPEPTPAWISLALGSAYFRTDALPDAEREYRSAIDVDAKLGEAHNNLAVVYMLTGRYPQADAEIKAAEKSGFRVNPQLKQDLKSAMGRE